MKKNAWKLLLMFFIVATTSCQPRADKEESVMEVLYLYSAKDTLLPDEDSRRMVPVVDRTISIAQNLDISEKIRILADSVSEYYFSGLEIEILGIDSTAAGEVTLRVGLIEHDNYAGPGSLPSYNSWYDFFQGSTGGQQTTIILRESFLQPHYEGKWPDAVIFYYQGEPMQPMDHIFLDGVIS